ncbi:unnamed protein product [Prunus armeniaca]|uniref:Uncharacterized protein n=1 Tax=Prunus armeniaca TaxID=36596 RepID=A0A6J5XB85_PRUAR|nr:unnamed protein product [Prunus armeniaca]
MARGGGGIAGTAARGRIGQVEERGIKDEVAGKRREKGGWGGWLGLAEEREEKTRGTKQTKMKSRDCSPPPP